MARRRLSFAWLRPPKGDPGGVMSLRDHLRELRYRVVLSVVVLIVAAIVAAIWYDELYSILLRPYLKAVEMLAQSHPSLEPQTVISGVTAPFMLSLKVSVMAGTIASSPFWLYQVWAFIAPALFAKEKRYAIIFIAVSVPLFLAGVVLGYYILPKGISVLLAFTPSTVPIVNLLDVQQFLTLVLGLMAVFGVGFLLPVIIVTLNFLGVVSGRRLGKIRTYVIFCIFVFGAVATPSTDPFSMLALSLPMVLLYVIAEVIARLHDRRHPKDEG
ncbi:MAG: twin-arginine translocase subunit TatC [Propionibacteriaceae bacterium]|nr:twin-arginine translocase subunit TatC [Propionibacteriaceae bacterium]